MKNIGIPNMTDSISLSSKCLIALFGINVPGGVTIWQPHIGSASQISMVPEGVAVYLDAYGNLAPQPSASRLFIHEEQSGSLRLALGHAILRHATQLYQKHPDVPAWQTWYHDFLDSCEPIKDAVMEELLTIQEHLEIKCNIQGKSTFLTPLQVCESYGVLAPVVEETKTGKTDGIFTGKYSYQRFNWIFKYLPRRILANGSEVIDLTALRAKLGM